MSVLLIAGSPSERSRSAGLLDAVQDLLDRVAGSGAVPQLQGDLFDPELQAALPMLQTPLTAALERMLSLFV